MLVEWFVKRIEKRNKIEISNILKLGKSINIQKNIFKNGWWWFLEHSKIIRHSSKHKDICLKWFSFVFFNQTFSKKLDFRKSYGSTFLFHLIFISHQSMNSKIPKCVVADFKTVWDKPNWRNNLENCFSHHEALRFSARQFQREHHCPGIALGEHDAKLHWVTRRATFLSSKTSN